MARNKKKVLLITFAFVIFGFLNRDARGKVVDCNKCDCTHAPVAEECKKCCGVVKGRVTSLANDSLELSTATGRQTFRLNESTQMVGNVKKGSDVIVIYDKKNKTAGSIKSKGDR